ncbi:hypothetical protein DEU56DRAFT_917856 [Suillus clintonianus]|uniref:uncharacterized protein n=1 Tax=Suillus clintonianus TaxID=1904413 RepID=UPI001B88120B|nr:uncharacterized protein DEU56DRAFT_917856 [Suillus clintonianus]KAG2122363.1 hypothetical protein DEU56DRAFT_917856 [Suillus clintonianus]
MASLACYRLTASTLVPYRLALFVTTHLLVDAAVSTEGPGVSEVTASLQVHDCGWKALDGIPCIMGGITALAASVGGTLHGRSPKDFPWKTLPNELARLGCCLVNYPEETLMPGEIRPTLRRTKGIHDLTIRHRANLVNALKTGTLTIRAITSDAARSRLLTSRDPIIIGEAPSHRSSHPRGRRAFADGNIDRKGPRRLPSPPATPTTRPATPSTRPATPPATPPAPLPAPPHPTTSAIRRHVQVFVEISRPPPRPAVVAMSRPPPRPASRAVHKSFLPPHPTHTEDLIPPITSVTRSSSTSEYDDQSMTIDDELSESDYRPSKRLRG